MKQEDYFRIMDCASDDDITEMMQHRRFRQVPSGEEEITVKQTAQKKIRMTRRGAAAGTAVAAALLALNVGGGYLLLHGRNAENPAAEQTESAFTEQDEAAVNIGTEEISEDIAADTEAAGTPQYVQLMQEYYNKLTDSPYYEGKTFEPCDYDFTGLGKDIDYTFEWDDYKLTYRAVVGCDWVLYYFFDVEPKQGQDYETFRNENPDMSRIAVSMIKGDTVKFGYIRLESRSTTLPEQNTWDIAPNNGVWHCVGMIRNVTDQPFFHGENAGTQISICEKYDTPEEAQQNCGEPFDFETKAFPLHACEQPVFFRDETHMSFAPAYHEDVESMLAEHTLTRCAETPFGRYYVSDMGQAGESFRSQSWVGPSLGLEGIAPRTLDATYFGEYKHDGEEIAHLLALYDRPVEAEEAE